VNGPRTAAKPLNVPMPPTETYHLGDAHAGLTLAQALKRLRSDKSWTQVKRLIAGRQVQVNGNLVLDEGRRVKKGDVLKVWRHSLAAPVSENDLRVAYADEHLVVIQKPAGITTLRHREETDLPQRRKQLQPTLDELVPQALARHLGLPLPDESSPQHPRGAGASGGSHRRRRPQRHGGRSLQVRAVHRLDRDTSGLMVFARTPQAEQALIRMFAKHAVQRAYVAVVPGPVEAQTIDTFLVRDRGDGLRGSSPLGAQAEGARRAITHVCPMEHIAAPGGETAYTILECRLETGRTHQIRIHLSEIGHPLCGEKLYTHPPGGKPIPDTSGAPRQALHAAELAFLHPITQQPLRFRMPLPPELKTWLLKLRGK
jgi:23S rRNA pseudouridine1911/1915/1917 synthase